MILSFSEGRQITLIRHMSSMIQPKPVDTREKSVGMPPITFTDAGRVAMENHGSFRASETIRLQIAPCKSRIRR